MPADIEIRTVTTAAGPVECADFGDADGPTVLTLHGSPGGVDQGIVMGRFLAAAGFRVLTMSRPGYLGTPLTDDTAPIDAQADLCVALLDAFEVESAGVLSWSGGGPVGYRLAVRHPDRVHALVALAALSHQFDWHLSLADRLMFGTWAGTTVIDLLLRLAPSNIVSGALQSEGDLTGDEVKRRTDEIMADDERRDFVLTLTKSATSRGDRHEGVENDQKCFAGIEDLELADIIIPTLIVAGDADTDVVPQFSEFAHEQIPDSELLVMPGGTHLCLYVDPGYQEAQQRVAEFLR